MKDLASVKCPFPGCDYGEDGKSLVLKATSMATAMRYRNEHIRSAHPGYKPPSGSIQDRAPKLD